MGETLEQQAETIIGRVLELPENDRQTAAMKACGGDVELLRRVMSLLSADPLASGFLDLTADAGAASFSSTATVGEKAGDIS